jgi:hypothetical protein
MAQYSSPNSLDGHEVISTPYPYRIAFLFHQIAIARLCHGTKEHRCGRVSLYHRPILAICYLTAVSYFRAGVAGLTTALLLSKNPEYSIVVAAKHMPGDYDIEYASPWAGANYMP